MVAGNNTKSPASSRATSTTSTCPVLQGETLVDLVIQEEVQDGRNNNPLRCGVRYCSPNIEEELSLLMAEEESSTILVLSSMLDDAALLTSGGGASVVTVP